jgi:hypothetical protein
MSQGLLLRRSKSAEAIVGLTVCVYAAVCFALSQALGVHEVLRSGDQGPHCRPLDPASLSLCSV